MKHRILVVEDNQPNRELLAIGWNRKASKWYTSRIWNKVTPPARRNCLTPSCSMYNLAGRMVCLWSGGSGKGNGRATFRSFTDSVPRMGEYGFR
jgi:hypothetical protein